MKRIVILSLSLLSATANAAFQPYVSVYDSRSHAYKTVKNCVVPIYGTLTPQPGYTADQTCDCNWSDRSYAYVLLCALPQGMTQVQTADPRVYVLVQLIGSTKLIPVPRPRDCR